jgi:hypothetical protein
MTWTTHILSYSQAVRYGQTVAMEGRPKDSLAQFAWKVSPNVVGWDTVENMYATYVKAYDDMTEAGCHLCRRIGHPFTEDCWPL